MVNQLLASYIEFNSELGCKLDQKTDPFENNRSEVKAELKLEVKSRIIVKSGIQS